MGTGMLLLGPFLDKLITGAFVSTYEWNLPSLVCLAFSCTFAVLVNISQFLCIGRFSAVSFQVVGHVKTVLVFFFGWLIFSAPVTEKNIAGSALALAGMVYYSIAVTREQKLAAEAAAAMNVAVVSATEMEKSGEPVKVASAV